jgi:hypothetical protein
MIERWELEDVAKNGRIENFDANVAIKQGCNQPGDEANGVAEGLPRVGTVRDALNLVSFSNSSTYRWTDLGNLGYT